MGAAAAERKGFEPLVPLRVRLISNQVPSAARSSLRGGIWTPARGLSTLVERLRTASENCNKFRKNGDFMSTGWPSSAAQLCTAAARAIVAAMRALGCGWVLLSACLTASRAFG